MNEVWRRSAAGASALMQTMDASLDELRPALARLTLYLLNAICFEDEEDCLSVLKGREDVPLGLKMSYYQAMANMLDYFPVVSHTPSVILSILSDPYLRSAC